MLDVSDVHTYYGDSYVLQGISLAVAPRQVIAILGRNGMGKTTLIRSIIGFTPPRRGRVVFKDTDITGWPSDRAVALGLGLVPQGRRVFPSLTVAENLAVAARRAGGRWTLARVMDLFPRLRERADHRAGKLSGGEQQMLAIGRALMTNPRLLILDEATEGLAPLVRVEIWRCLRQLKAQGQSILLIDKNVAALTALADVHYILEKGRVVWHGASAELMAREDIQHRYLGV